MDQVSVFDAKNRLSALLDQVEQGSEITITRRGEPVARLVPAGALARAGDAADRLLALRSRIAAGGARFSWDEMKEWRDEGRPG